MNLRHFAQDIGRGARPASDVKQLETFVDRKLVLLWAQTQALRITANNTLEEIERELAELEILQGMSAASAWALPAGRF